MWDDHDDDGLSGLAEELRGLRERMEAIEGALARLDRDDDDGQPARVVQVVGAVLAGKYFAANPVTVGGPETEGATPTFEVHTDATVYVANLGTGKPAAGTRLIAEGSGDRNVTRYDG